MSHPETDAEDAPIPEGREAQWRRTLPKYRSHKVVGALKIAQVEHLAGQDGLIVPEDTAFAPFRVSAEYLLKHQPHAGGYFVLYADGYESFSPGPQFENGYTPVEE